MKMELLENKTNFCRFSTQQNEFKHSNGISLCLKKKKEKSKTNFSVEYETYLLHTFSTYREIVQEQLFVQHSTLTNEPYFFILVLSFVVIEEVDMLFL